MTNDASEGRTIFVTDAHRGDGKRFVVRSDEKLSAFLELGRTYLPGKLHGKFIR